MHLWDSFCHVSLKLSTRLLTGGQRKIHALRKQYCLVLDLQVRTKDACRGKLKAFFRKVSLKSTLSQTNCSWVRKNSRDHSCILGRAQSPCKQTSRAKSVCLALDWSKQFIPTTKTAASAHTVQSPGCSFPEKLKCCQQSTISYLPFVSIKCWANYFY